MKFTTEELSELQFYLEHIRPDTQMGFREENDEVLEFPEFEVVFYKAKVNVLSTDPETKEESISKRVVYFLETHQAEIRKTVHFTDASLALLVFMAAEETRIGFDLVRMDYKASHPDHEGAYLLQ